MAEPRVLPFADAARRARALPAVTAHLRAGGLMAYPTETVYGFGCALRADAVRELARLKRRPPERPFLLLVEGPAQVPELAWTPAARALADAFWPGPLTLALPLREPGRLAGLPLLPEVVSPGGTVAVRVSPHAAALALVRGLGEPITSTSANAPGEPPARDAAAAAAAVAALGASPAFLVLDGGVLAPSAPSTILDCAGARPRVLRAGALSLDTLRTIVPEIDA